MIAQLMAAPLPQKLLKIYNLRTTNAMRMKLGMIVYLHKTFLFDKKFGRGTKGSEEPPKWFFWAHFIEFSRIYQNP